MAWRLNETNVLLAEVKKRPLLWNTSLPLYKDKGKRSEAWSQIARSISSDVVGKPVAEAKKVRELQSRWKSIRDSYSKHLKRVKRYGKHGLKNRPYLFAGKLSFLDKFMTFRDVDSESNGNGREFDHCDNNAAQVAQRGGGEEEEEEEDDDDGSIPLDIECQEELGIVGLADTVKTEPEFRQEMETLDTSTPGSCHQLQASVLGASAASTPVAGSKSDWWMLEKMVRQSVRLERNEAEERDPDMAFFASLLPTLRGFTEDQKLEFRTDVLLAVRAVKSGSRRTDSQVGGVVGTSTSHN